MNPAILMVALSFATAPVPAPFPAIKPVSALGPQIQVLTPLSFGGLLVQPGGGRITLTPGGSLLPEGQGVFPGAAPAAGYARIRLRGPAGAQFRLALNPAAPVLHGSSGGTLRMAMFQPSLPAMTGTFDASGSFELDLGGTLDIPARAPAGMYVCPGATLQMSVDGVSGTVVQPLTLSCTLRAPLNLFSIASLDFGGLVPGRTAGVFRVDVAGGHRTDTSGGPTLFKGAPHPAGFLLTGPARSFYSILLPREAIMQGPAGTMRMHDFTCDAGPTGQLPDAGLVFHVGAGLDVAANQPPGNYRGSFQVTVFYP